MPITSLLIVRPSSRCYDDCSFAPEQDKSADGSSRGRVRYLMRRASREYRALAGTLVLYVGPLR